MQPAEQINNAKTRLQQLRYELDGWKRLLNFLQEENNHLKERIASLLKESSATGIVKEAEQFHTRFLKEDDRFLLLRNDIAELEHLLPENRKPANPGLVMLHKVVQLRSNTRHAENHFLFLKETFNTYLANLFNVS